MRYAIQQAGESRSFPAGDAFLAGFLSARLGGAGLEACLAKAVVAGALATTWVGGRPYSP